MRTRKTTNIITSDPTQQVGVSKAPGPCHSPACAPATPLVLPKTTIGKQLSRPLEVARSNSSPAVATVAEAIKAGAEPTSGAVLATNLDLARAYMSAVESGGAIEHPQVIADMSRLADYAKDLAVYHRGVTDAEIADHVDKLLAREDGIAYFAQIGKDFVAEEAQSIRSKHNAIADALEAAAVGLEKLLPDALTYSDALQVATSVSKAISASQKWTEPEKVDQTYINTGKYAAFRAASVGPVALDGKYSAFAEQGMVAIHEFMGPSDKLTDNRDEILEMMAVGVHLVALTAKSKVIDDRRMDCADCTQHDMDHLNLNRNNAKPHQRMNGVAEGRGFIYSDHPLKKSDETHAVALLDQLAARRDKTRDQSEDGALVAEFELSIAWSVFHEFGYPIHEENLAWSVRELATDLDAFRAELGADFDTKALTAPTDASGREWKSWFLQQKTQEEAKLKIAELEKADPAANAAEIAALKHQILPVRGTHQEGALNKAGVRFINAQGVHAKRAMTLNQLIMREVAMFDKSIDANTDTPRLVKAYERALANIAAVLPEPS